MKRLIILLIAVCPFIAFGQIATLKCYNNETFKEADCYKCNIKAKTFSGIVVKYNNRDYAFYNPVRFTVVGTSVTFEDAFESPKLTLSFSKIQTYNTIPKLADFLKTCSCNDCQSGGGGGTDTYLSGASISGNDIVLTMSNGSIFTLSNVVNKETVYINGVGVPISPANDANNRAYAVGDKYLDTSTGDVYRYNGSSWVLIYSPTVPVPLWESFTLNGSGQATLSVITGFGVLSASPELYQVEIEGQIQYLHRNDFTVSGQTLTFNGGAVNAGQRGTVRKLY